MLEISSKDREYGQQPENSKQAGQEFVRDQAVVEN
jgi:hypothetical protein